MNSRRQFLQNLLMGFMPFALYADLKKESSDKMDIHSHIYRAVNGTPAENMARVVELYGGIEKIIGSDDIVILKPNLQWWNHGATNLEAFMTFVDLIFTRSGGFKGEVVLAENVHRGSRPDLSESSWTRSFEWNATDGMHNMTDVVHSLKEKYKDQFSWVYLIDVRSGAKQIVGPEEGEGYVYCDGTQGNPRLELHNNHPTEPRTTLMTYPVFKTDRGTVVDFKNGVWEKGQYTDQPVRFINFPALNYHGRYCGMTSCIKNYFGVVDLGGGPDPHTDGKLNEDYFNFHSFSFDDNAQGPVPGMFGTAVGMFMDTIRKADLNIVTADWVGLASRTIPPIARTRAVLMSDDPVALDYHSAKYLLYPNSKINLHDPDDVKGPLHTYLEACGKVCKGEIDEEYVQVHSYDLKNNTLQSEDELTIIGELKWGRDLKHWLKYFLLRFDLV